MTEHYDQREALHALRQPTGRDVDTEAVREAWVIEIDITMFFETVRKARLSRRGGRWFCDDKFFHKEQDVFTTELAARNELEQRLYQRSENLRKHREAMSRLLVMCADTFNQEQEATK